MQSNADKSGGLEMLGMNFSSDPVADAERREVDYEKWLKTKNVCFGCKECINEDYAYHIANHIYCKNCVESSKEYF